MFSRILRRLRHNALAIVALVFAIGGTSYAAITLPAGSVGTKQLRAGAVTLKKISTAAQASLKGDTGPAGPRGATGAQGLTGAQGASGPQGVPGVENVVVRYGATVQVPKSGPIVRDGYAYCQSGEKVVGGGAKMTDDPSDPPASGTPACGTPTRLRVDRSPRPRLRCRATGRRRSAGTPGSSMTRRPLPIATTSSIRTCSARRDRGGKRDQARRLSVGAHAGDSETGPDAWSGGTPGQTGSGRTPDSGKRSVGQGDITPLRRISECGAG
jgi:hypothetical protein